MQKPVDEKKIQKLNYTLNLKKKKNVFIPKKKKDHTCLNVFSNWLPAMSSKTRFLGKWDGSEGNGYLCQSSNFNPLGRYSRRPQQCTLRIVSNLRFFILRNICTFNCNFTGLGRYNIML